MTRRTDWSEVMGPVEGGNRDSGGPATSRAGAGPPREPDQSARARAICLRLLTAAPRTREQLAGALTQRGIPEEVTEETLVRFEDVGLIDDAAFANAWVESRHHSRGLARSALSRELRSRGVEGSLIEEAIVQLDSDQEEATARALVDRKLKSTRGVEPNKRLRRLVAMLARKGYSEGVALRVVREALAEEGTDSEVLERYLPEGQ